MINIPILINTNDITSQFNVSEAQISSILDGVAKSLALIYFSKLEQEALNNLHQTRNRYIRNIQLVDSGKLSGTVLLDYSKDKLVKMLEEGSSPFDMKPGILGGPNAKVSKGGVRYNTIPFRWATPNTVGESEAFSGRLPSEIYNIVKNFTVKNPLQGRGGTSSPLQLANEPTVSQQLITPKVRPTIYDTQGKVLFHEYTHRSSIYEGMFKKKDGVTGQNTYHTFRRVSENSDSSAFIHPGFTARRFIQAALSKMDIEGELGALIDKELLNLGFSVGT